MVCGYGHRSHEGFNSLKGRGQCEAWMGCRGQEKADCTFQVVHSHPRGPLSEGESDSPAWDHCQLVGKGHCFGSTYWADEL